MNWVRYGQFREVLPWPERLKYDGQMRQEMERQEWRVRLEARCGLTGAALDRACAEAETVGYERVYYRASAGHKF